MQGKHAPLGQPTAAEDGTGSGCVGGEAVTSAAAAVAAAAGEAAAGEMLAATQARLEQRQTLLVSPRFGGKTDKTGAISESPISSGG